MKIAVILFNLGGPDSLDAVQPFLRNLFSDPAIIGLPTWLRLPLARFIAARRTPKAMEIYAKIGGSSPILGQTEAQARALEEALGSEHEWRGYVCMRYWHPMTEAVVRSVKRFAPDRIVLLPLYPQFSTTTTGSSIKAWSAAAGDFKMPTVSVESYQTEPGFIRASVELIREGLGQAKGATRVLFSAHGLPEKIIKAGDPYQRQVEETAAAIGEHLGGTDWTVCYQSRVGPLRWIGPSTEAEIERAAKDKVSIVLYPLSFVSEHSETLVELDIDYRHLAREAGVPTYVRVPTVGTHPLFIHGLANLVKAALMDPLVYNILKALHVVAVIAWMAGLLYLPRLFVYHADAPVGSPQSETFKVMERRLLRGIMNPAMVLVWVFGLLVAQEGNWWHAGWWQVKFSLVVGLTLVHHLYSRWRKEFEADKNTRPARYYRWWNEVPTLLMIAIVFLAVLKPF